MLGSSSSFATVTDPELWFDKAVQYDVDGKDASLAYAWYRLAAEAGLPEAEFNVAVMLDSGRGVVRDIAQAATWYARAAAHGNRRAAYNLGQLYEAGQGVPRNSDMARAWFVFSDLAAARARLAVPLKDVARIDPLSAPVPIAPNLNDNVGATTNGIELVWTSKPGPEQVRFFVELRAFDGSGTREVFSGSTNTSSVLANLTNARGDYAWRVFAVARKASRYVASEWSRFTITPK